MAKTLLALLCIVSLPGLLSATSSSNRSPNGIPSLKQQTQLNSRGGESDCLNGWCSEDGSCNCNPCWSGLTCQEYVDNFGPRFLADEPFFRVTRGAERDASGTEVPLFRIESADDDLGLTCQLGQVGPAATCPCATPRYKVVGPSRALFRADPETGDVFIKPGYSLQEGRHYLITLQVAALEVNASGYHPWREEVRAGLYVQRKEVAAFPQPYQHTSSWQDENQEEQSRKEETAEVPHKSPSSITTVTTSSSVSPSSQLRSPQQIFSGESEPEATEEGHGELPTERRRPRENENDWEGAEDSSAINDPLNSPHPTFRLAW